MVAGILSKPVLERGWGSGLQFFGESLRPEHAGLLVMYSKQGRSLQEQEACITGNC